QHTLSRQRATQRKGDRVLLQLHTMGAPRGMIPLGIGTSLRIDMPAMAAHLEQGSGNLTPTNRPRLTGTLTQIHPPNLHVPEILDAKPILQIPLSATAALWHTERNHSMKTRIAAIILRVTDRIA